MTTANAEWVRRAYVAVETADAEWLRANVPADFVYETLPDFPEGSMAYTGPEGILALAQFIDDTWAGFESHLESLEAEGETLVAITRVRSVSRHTGVRQETRARQDWDFRGSLPLRVRTVAIANA